MAADAEPAAKSREGPFARVLTIAHTASLAPLVALLLPETRMVSRVDAPFVAQTWRPTLAFAPVEDDDGLRAALAVMAARPEIPLVVAAATPKLARAAVRAGAFAVLAATPAADEVRAVLLDVTREHDAVWALA